jgi:hypothetical protein
MRDAAIEVTGRMFAAVMFTDVWRDGGQRGSRRNAWAAMVVDSQRARDRAEANALLDSPHGPQREEGELRRA